MCQINAALKMVEQMLATYSFFFLAYSALKEMEGEMTSLLKSLTALRNQTEIDHHQTLSQAARFKMNLVGEREADVKPFNPELTMERPIPTSPKFSGLRLFKGPKKTSASMRAQHTRSLCLDPKDEEPDWLASEAQAVSTDKVESDFDQALKDAQKFQGTSVHRGVLNIRLETKKWLLAYCAVER
eukprot:m.55625 g.55625  ORF g.55625 m.55625 type:complete len:185 (-) comp48891_c0_seq1:80-634(-)